MGLDHLAVLCGAGLVGGATPAWFNFPPDSYLPLACFAANPMKTLKYYEAYPLVL